MRRIWILSALLAGALATGKGRQPATAAVSATAPLGSVTSVQVTLDNLGQPAVTAQLYEAFDAPQLPTRAFASGPLRVSPPSGTGPITSDLLAAFANAPDGQSDMIIYLADQADLNSAAAIPDWNLRGATVVATLEKQAAATQAPLLALLQKSGYNPRSFWIVNALEVKGDRLLAEMLAGQPGVALVAANAQHTLASDPRQDSADGADQVGWGLQRIRVPSVWADWGARGAGITVANLDTGVAYTHTALLHQYRGWSPNGISNDYNWYDAAGAKPMLQPGDPVGHGTHTMGIMVGGSAGGYAGLGVAPASRWIAVRGCDDVTCSDDALIAGAQWILAPTDLAGKNQRPDLRPQVVNNSWGQAGDSPWYSDYVTAWNASGIFSAFANGNNGTFGGCENTLTPGNYSNSFAVGATDDSDIAAQFSSRGPTGDGRTKPDISAPGVKIPSAWPDGSVKLLSGTSMATPHVAGVVALLWSANPTLIGDLAATEHILTTTVFARPTTECSSPSTTSPNNVYGWGRLDARAAVQEARVDVPWMSIPASADLPANGTGQFTLTLDGRQVTGPGTYTARILVKRNSWVTSIPVIFTVQPAANTAGLRGRLTDLWQSSSVYGRVQIGAGPAVQSDPNGFYTVTLPYGSYGLTASATGYFSATSEVNIGAPAATDFILQPDQPHLESDSAPISATLDFAQRVVVPITVTNAGSQALQVTTNVPPLDWVVEKAGTLAGILYDLSGVTPISLTDDSVYTQPLQLGFRVPIYGALVDRLYLSSNGWVSAAAPTSAEPLANCLPNGNLPLWSLAPFWADLDPGVGGTVRFAQVNASTFVVSFERVPPWRQTPDPAGPTYTFQLVLHGDGNIEFLYGPMGALPDRWSVGASFDQTRGLQLACYRTTPILSGTVWQLRNQPDSNLWLDASTSGFKVKPGQSVAFDAVLSGYGYAAWHTDPFVGTLRLLSNDPGHPSVDLPARASIGPPSHQVVLPVINR